MQWCFQLLYTHPDLLYTNQSRDPAVRSSVQSTAKLPLLPPSTVKGLPSMDAHRSGTHDLETFSDISVVFWGLQGMPHNLTSQEVQKELVANFSSSEL